jgi:hypothetical protein
VASFRSPINLHAAGLDSARPTHQLRVITLTTNDHTNCLERFSTHSSRYDQFSLSAAQSENDIVVMVCEEAGTLTWNQRQRQASVTKKPVFGVSMRLQVRRASDRRRLALSRVTARRTDRDILPFIIRLFKPINRDANPHKQSCPDN